MLAYVTTLTCSHRHLHRLSNCHLLAMLKDTSLSPLVCFLASLASCMHVQALRHLVSQSRQWHDGLTYSTLGQEVSLADLATTDCWAETCLRYTMPPTNHQINQHAWVSCHLMLSCSQAPCREPRTLIPSSQTACIDWLPLYTTSRGDMGRPSLYICQEWGSATVELGANCTHMACDTYRSTYIHILINSLIDISHGFSLMFKCTQSQDLHWSCSGLQRYGCVYQCASP